MATNAAPIVDRIRIIPRPEDFLDRNVGSSGEVFFSRETNSLRVYSGKVAGGYELAKTDLTNISNSDFATKATAAGVGGSATPEWDAITGKPNFATVATTGDYNDLTNKPSDIDLSSYATIDYVNSQIVASNGKTFSFAVAADDSTQVEISSNETIKFSGGPGITTTSDAEGNITISTSTTGLFSGLSDATTASLTIDKIYQPAITTFRLENVGVTAFTFSPHYTGNNPTVYAISGTTVAFDLDNIGGHPFEIQDSLAAPFNTGLVHVAANGTISTGADAQGKDSGTLYWTIPEAEGGTFRYQCQNHVAMVGAISVKRLSLI